MSAADLAALHARCFVVPRPFTADEITGFLADASCFLIGDAEGFALGRAILDEAELLTLAVDPTQRRKGLGRRLMQGFEAEAAKRGAVQAYLEVASGNAAGIALYQSVGFAEVGRRTGYYRSVGGEGQDAIVMQKLLNSA